MQRSGLLALASGFAVAAISRGAEIGAAALGINPAVNPVIGAAVVWVVSSLLVFHILILHRKRRLVLEEKDRLRSHIHHHVRNALQVITLRAHHDPLVMAEVDRITEELEMVLPTSGTVKTPVTQEVKKKALAASSAG